LPRYWRERLAFNFSGCVDLRMYLPYFQLREVDRLQPSVGVPFHRSIAL
jgi:hypothetical protein